LTLYSAGKSSDIGSTYGTREKLVMQYLDGIGIGQSKANKMIKAAEAEQAKTNVIIRESGR
jgi:hypothetical protein